MRRKSTKKSLVLSPVNENKSNSNISTSSPLKKTIADSNEKIDETVRNELRDISIQLKQAQEISRLEREVMSFIFFIKVFCKKKKN